MLQVRDLHAYYGQSHILHGIHLDVGARMQPGEVRSGTPARRHGSSQRV